jgi:hypothetical protein
VRKIFQISRGTALQNLCAEIFNKRTKSLGHSSAKLEPSNKVGLRISYARAADWIRLDSRINNSALRERPMERATWTSSLCILKFSPRVTTLVRPSALRTNTCLYWMCAARARRSLYIAQINSPQEKKNCPALRAATRMHIQRICERWIIVSA